MIRWDLDAHSATEVETTPELLSAALAMPRLLRVERFVDGKARVVTTGIVGTRVESQLRVVVHPRHLSRDVALGLVIGGADLRLTALPAEADDDDELLRVVAVALFATVQVLLRRGVRREYVGRAAQLEQIRGELDLERWHGPSSPDGGLTPWCRFRDRTVDLPEHRLLRAALRALSRASALERPLRLRAASLEERFADVPARAPQRQTWSRLRTTGLFRSYAEPLALAAIVLEGLTGEGSGNDSGRGFLLDLDRLFERWLVRELSLLAPAGWYVSGQETVRIAEPSLHRFLDVGIRDVQGRLRMILDAKNKALTGKKPPRDDLHQLITYMSTLQCREGALICVAPRQSGVIKAVYDLHGEVGRLQVVGLPGLGSVEALITGLTQWVEAEAAWSKSPTSGVVAVA